MKYILPAITLFFIPLFADEFDQPDETYDANAPMMEETMPGGDAEPTPNPTPQDEQGEELTPNPTPQDDQDVEETLPTETEKMRMPDDNG